MNLQRLKAYAPGNAKAITKTTVAPATIRLLTRPRQNSGYCRTHWKDLSMKFHRNVTRKNWSEAAAVMTEA